ncbi:MAG: hypothetical protein HLUCCA04_06090 [Oceanicaulis sp. HLUCCA04]|nr:MAG: hypothetical protein HLUCCA04_06090 [Oceanicaulis sp. HLUCCA04]
MDAPARKCLTHHQPDAIEKTGAPLYVSCMTGFLDVLLYILMAVVFVILCVGVYSLVRGGDFGRSWSNRLMRARVLFQFLAVLVIVAGFWAKGAFGS